MLKTILITGVAGFIGSTLAESLLGEYRVIGIDNFDNFYSRDIKEKNLKALLSNRLFKFVEGSIIDIEKLLWNEDSPDCIVHLAAKAGVHPSILFANEYIETNIGGTQAILDFMVKRNLRKLVFGSSSSVYGDSDKVPFAEDSDTDYQISPYAVTKKTGELLCHTYAHLYKLDILCLRFFTVYGPRQRPDLAIHKFFDLIRRRETIQIYGDGSMARDYTYIDDTVEGIRLALKYVLQHSDFFEVINLGNEYPVSLSELISEISQIVPGELIVENVAEKPGDVKITFADISKAKRLLGYHPKTSISEGLRLFYKWHIRKER